MKMRRINKGKFYILILFFGTGVALTTYAMESRQGSAFVPSIELGFTSLSPNGSSGGEIIPASCESRFRYSATLNSWGNYFSGYDHYYNRPLVRRDRVYPRIESGGSYAVDNFVGSQGLVFCFGNQGGPTYFAPTNTWAEFQSFWNKLPNLSGLYYIPDIDGDTGGSD